MKDFDMKNDLSILVTTNNCENILIENGYNKPTANVGKYIQYVKPLEYTQTFIGSMYNSDYSYEQWIDFLINKLLQAKALITQPDYEMQKQEYLNKLNQLEKKVNDVEQPIHDNLTQMFDLLKQSKRDPKLIDDTSKMIDFSKSPQHKHNIDALFKFKNNNMVMEISLKYCDNSRELIDNDIMKLRERYTNACEQYISLSKLFSNLLQYENTIYFSCHMLDELTDVREICISDLTIDDLAKLKSNETLAITNIINEQE